MDISIIIPTRNRAEDLRQTLRSIDALCLPAGRSCELLVVDNASTDATAEVVRSGSFPNFPVRYHYAPRPGVARARNAALAAAQGDILLFLDDDLRCPPHWIQGMCEPLWSGKAHAVAGGVQMASHLSRPWMQPLHRACLAETTFISADAPDCLVGANMALAREVLCRVPAFDEALGVGELGMCEETLFARQLCQAGYRIVSRLDIVAEHHFDPARLRRSAWQRLSQRIGESEGYIDYHWKHAEIAISLKRWIGRRLRFLLYRTIRSRRWKWNEGMPVWEIELRKDMAHLNFLRRMRGRTRNYDKLGLKKREHHA